MTIGNKTFFRDCSIQNNLGTIPGINCTRVRRSSAI